MTDENLTNIESYLKMMAKYNASDCFLTAGAAPSMKINGVMKPVSKHRLEAAHTRMLAESVLTDQQLYDFESLLEMNAGIERSGIGRFRINFYYQRGDISMVIRYIKSQIPRLEDLTLPEKLKELIMLKTGLIMVVGATGSGKSTTLAAMLDYRNSTEAGHILTIEDPIEFSFQHKKSIVGQREVGLDTLSYENALKEAMREAPDVIMIGEIRDKSTMEQALAFADTGHLCLSTLHATNAHQALDRIVNFFPRGERNQVLMDLSINLRSIISQRLLKSPDGGRVPAVEVLINSPYVGELIKAGKIDDVKEAMEKGATLGMQTFDSSLLELYQSGKIELKEALANADSQGELEWKINFGEGAAKNNTVVEEELLKVNVTDVGRKIQDPLSDALNEPRTSRSVDPLDVMPKINR